MRALQSPCRFSGGGADPVDEEREWSKSLNAVGRGRALTEILGMIQHLVQSVETPLAVQGILCNMSANSRYWSSNVASYRSSKP